MSYEINRRTLLKLLSAAAVTGCSARHNSANGLRVVVADVGIEDVRIGWRPLPIDGHPVLGTSPARPDVYLAIMHSGVTLAPIVGQLAAHELTADTPVERLDEYRPDRSFKLIKRY